MICPWKMLAFNTSLTYYQGATGPVTGPVRCEKRHGRHMFDPRLAFQQEWNHALLKRTIIFRDEPSFRSGKKGSQVVCLSPLGGQGQLSIPPLFCLILFMSCVTLFMHVFPSTWLSSLGRRYRGSNVVKHDDPTWWLHRWNRGTP